MKKFVIIAGVLLLILMGCVGYRCFYLYDINNVHIEVTADMIEGENSISVSILVRNNSFHDIMVKYLNNDDIYEYLKVYESATVIPAHNEQNFGKSYNYANTQEKKEIIKRINSTYIFNIHYSNSNGSSDYKKTVVIDKTKDNALIKS